MWFSTLAALALSSNVVSINASPTTTAAADCCNALASYLPSAYFGPSSAEYGRLTTARWSNTSMLHPGCVIAPTSAKDMSTAIKTLVKGQCQFAVKSGGHNANPGANSIDGGVSIDLGGLTSTSLAKDRSYVSLGTGLNWGQAYAAFTDRKIAFTGGICEAVGVGGLAIGGGQSLFQASKGWVVDNIRQYELVLASGDIIKVNMKSHPELFRALKGGSTNFGIVTSIDLAAFDYENIWGGEILLNLTGAQASRSDMLDKLSRATVNFIDNNNDDLDTGLQVVTTYIRGNRAQIVDLAVSNTANVADPPALNEFYKMPNQFRNTTRHTTLANIAHETSEAVPRGFRYVTASITISNDYQTLREIWDASDKVYNAIPAMAKVDWMMSFVPQPVVQQQYAAKTGGNVLGLSNVKEDQIVLWLLSRWNEPELDTMMDEARQKFLDDAEAIAKKHSKYSPFVYLNYAGPKQKPLCGYGADNVAFIKKVAKKYDPQGVFQKLMPGGFKIDNAAC